MGNVKKRNVIIIAVAAAVLIALTVTLCVLFCPRKLSSAIDANNIESVELIVEGKDSITLSEAEITEFAARLKSEKYTLRFSEVKSISAESFKITYADKIIKADSWRVIEYDKNGNSTGKTMINTDAIGRIFKEFYPSN